MGKMKGKCEKWGKWKKWREGGATGPHQNTYSI